MKKKYLTTILFMFSLFLGTTDIVLAEEKKVSQKEYVKSELGDYLAGWGYDSEDKVEISQKYKIYDAENDSSLFFVKVDNVPVGAINVTKVDGKNRSAFLYGEDIFKEIDEEEKLAVSSNGNGINLCNKNGTKVLTGRDTGVDKKEYSSKYKLKQIEYKDITDSIQINSSKIKIKNSKMDIQTSNGDYETNFSYIGTHQRTYEKIINTENMPWLYIMKLNLVMNNTMNGQGLCWAASGASIIAYKRGGNFFLTAVGVYTELKKKYGGTPEGTIEWEQRMWDYYALSMTRVDHKLSYNTILNLMGSLKPIYCSFLHNEQNTNNNYAHAVVLCGCYYRTDLDRYYYIYMDPNWASQKLYVVNHIFEAEMNGDSGYRFYYNPGDGTIYNNWRYAFY